MSNTLISFFNELFGYHRHFNAKFIEYIDENKAKVPHEVNRLFSHILNAHHIWNNRIMGHPVRYTPWDIQDSSGWRTLDQENFQCTFSILEKKELDEVIRYRISTGQPFANSVQNILFHVVNHTTHHKAQISALLRAHGIEPLVTDYIFYKR